MAGAVIDAILHDRSLSVAADPRANSRAENAARHALAIVEVTALFAVLALAAAALVLAAYGVALGADPVCKTNMFSWACAMEVAIMGVKVFIAAIIAVLVAGLLRITFYDRWFEGK